METVSIKIPASPEYLHVVRLVAAGLGARLGFTLDDIEDLKIAVDELAAYLTGAHGRDGHLRIRFTIGDDTLEIEGAGHFSPQQPLRTELTDFSRMILETVADSATFGNVDSTPCFSLLKRKQP
jgi:anti-sigma regulatory factor (Ser/Thr protein kinase)